MIGDEAVDYIILESQKEFAKIVEGSRSMTNLYFLRKNIKRNIGVAYTNSQIVSSAIQYLSKRPQNGDTLGFVEDPQEIVDFMCASYIRNLIGLAS